MVAFNSVGPDDLTPHFGCDRSGHLAVTASVVRRPPNPGVRRYLPCKLRFLAWHRSCSSPGSMARPTNPSQRLREVAPRAALGNARRWHGSSRNKGDLVRTSTERSLSARGSHYVVPFQLHEVVRRIAAHRDRDAHPRVEVSRALRHGVQHGPHMVGIS
jgi:hypothetical protein